MVFEISEYYTGGKIRLKPRVELYDTRDYMGKQMPGLAIVLDEVDQKENVTEQYAVLTVSFGDFLTLKNCAFIDTNNCPFASQLLSNEVAQDTGHSKISGAKYSAVEIQKKSLTLVSRRKLTNLL